MKTQVLTQAEIEALSDEEYSNFLAFGDPEVPELSDEEYDRYFLSKIIFDL